MFRLKISVIKHSKLATVLYSCVFSVNKMYNKKYSVTSHTVSKVEVEGKELTAGSGGILL